MKLGLLGKKLGMTQVFTEEGKFVPVTVIEAGPCTVLNIRGKKVLLGFGNKKEKNTSNAMLGLYKKVKVSPKAFIKEIMFDIDEEISVGKEIAVDIFREKDSVDIIGNSIGKGFQGGVKRWHWRGGPSGHGSMHHRRIGSIGGSSFPSRVFKGQRMPGRMGNKKRTVQNLEIVKVYKDKNLLLVKGPVPGPKNSYLELRIAKKKPVVRSKDEKKSEEQDNKKD
ncbi:MAG: 50S ribosomal protein L3 [Candidatus Omnitrophica bacterium]|nr:50S ribosomal protein L3 [Candidatus Omnitrophota bacterium]MBU1853563.1 50S ribosomal protein L3 [Candidatus Omnitrophota bacterium]